MNNLESYGLKNTENIWEWGVTHSNEFKTALHENCSLVFERLKLNLDETKEMPSDAVKKLLGQLKKSTKLLDEYYLIYLKFLASTHFIPLQKNPAIEACKRGGKFLDAIPDLLDLNSQGLKTDEIDQILIKAIKFGKVKIMRSLEKHQLIDRKKLHEFHQKSLTIRKSPFEPEEISEYDSLDSGRIDKLCTAEKLHELNLNLEEVIKHYPKYILANDFSVCNQFPTNWNPKKIRSELKELQQRLLQTLILDVNEQLILSLNIQKITDDLKPKTPVCLGILIAKRGESGTAMLEGAKVSIYKDQPTVITMGLYETHPAEFEELFKKKNLQVYYQEEGDKERIMLILPKGEQAESLGFAVSDLSVLDKDKNLLKPWQGKDLGDKKSKSTFNKNLQQIFLPEQEDQGFYRIISVRAHGGTSSVIVGLDRGKEFQEFLAVLKDHHTAFLSLSSCNLGGESSTEISLPNGEIPYPIYVESSTEVSSYSNRMLNNSFIDDENSISLNSIKFLLFPDIDEENQVYRSPKPLSIKKISGCVNFSGKQVPGALSNLGTIFQPTPVGVPKVAYTVSKNPLVLDISNALKAIKKTNSKNKKIVIMDSGKAIAYLFSEPLISATVCTIGKIPKALLSRGGNSHHIIKEIIALDLQIEDFGVATFNVFTKENNDYENVNKAFFIGKIKCQYNGKPAEITNVVISINGNKRKIIFKHPEEEKYRVIKFSKNTIEGLTRWEPQKERDLPISKAIFHIFKWAAASGPSPKALLQMTAGKTRDEDFYEALTEQFWGTTPPFEAQLYHAEFRNPLIFIKEENLKNEKTVLQSSPTGELLEILKTRKDRISLMKNTLTLGKIRKLSKKE